MADLYLDPSDGNTRAHCCPSNAAFVTSETYFAHCASPATSPGTLVLESEATTGGSFLIVQKAILVAWKSEDLSNFTPSSAPLSQTPRASQAVLSTSAFPSPTQYTRIKPQPSTTESASRIRATSASTTRTKSTLASTSATRASSASPAKPLSTMPEPDSSLSTGAKAGIGVGAIIGGIIVALLIALVWILRKKQSEKAESQSGNPHQTNAHGSYTGGNPTRGSYSSPEAKHFYTVAQSKPYELSPERRRAELDGDTGGRL